MPQLFCFGLGYCALHLARCLKAEGWSIVGTTRHAAKAESLARDEGFRLLVRGSDTAPVNADADLAQTTHILISAAPDETGDPVLKLWADAIVRARPAWVGYLSTTGVYGDRAGGWVDETSACTPTQQRSLDRLAAENGWLALHRDHQIPVHLFRLAGIYGPGRSALDTVRSGRAQRIVKPGQVFSRIHVDDIATTLIASIHRPDPGAVYNLADDHPAPPDAVIAAACRLLGIEAPPPIPFDAASLSPMAASFYADNRRVSNRKIKEALGVVLRYPDYATGLKALLKGGF